MKSLVFLCATVVLLEGCAGGIGYRVSPDPHSGYMYRDEVRIRPCKPYYANELMAWAKALPGDKEHTRRADVRTQDGYVSCETHESAQSRDVSGRR